MSESLTVSGTDAALPSTGCPSAGTARPGAVPQARGRPPAGAAQLTAKLSGPQPRRSAVLPCGQKPAGGVWAGEAHLAMPSDHWKRERDSLVTELEPRNRGSSPNPNVPHAGSVPLRRSCGSGKETGERGQHEGRITTRTGLFGEALRVSYLRGCGQRQARAVLLLRFPDRLAQRGAEIAEMGARTGVRCVQPPAELTSGRRRP